MVFSVFLGKYESPISDVWCPPEGTEMLYLIMDNIVM